MLSLLGVTVDVYFTLLTDLHLNIRIKGLEMQVERLMLPMLHPYEQKRKFLCSYRLLKSFFVQQIETLNVCAILTAGISPLHVAQILHFLFKICE